MLAREPTSARSLALFETLTVPIPPLTTVRQARLALGAARIWDSGTRGSADEDGGLKARAAVQVVGKRDLRETLTARFDDPEAGLLLAADKQVACKVGKLRGGREVDVSREVVGHVEAPRGLRSAARGRGRDGDDGVETVGECRDRSCSSGRVHGDECAAAQTGVDC